MNKKFDLLSELPPEMPKKLPALVKHAIGPVPNLMKCAAAQAIFPGIAAQVDHLKFTYIDNVNHEPTLMEGVIAQSGLGKGYLDPMKEAIIRKLRKDDEVSRRKLEEYDKEYKKKSANQAKPERPTDVAIRVPEPDMSNPAFIQLLKDVGRAGDLALYTDVGELEQLNDSCGGHRKVTQVIRLNFDTKTYGAQRATPDGVSGNPILRWRFCFSTTPGRAQQFFKDGLTDGTLGRIGICYVPKPTGKRKVPVQGKYDDAYQDKLEFYLDRIRSEHGVLKVARCNSLISRLADEMTAIAELAEDDDFQSLANRSLVNSWLKGCLLYLSEGKRWTNEIAAFVEYSVYRDLWSKIAIFAPQLRKASEKVVIDARKYGPANMLDMMPLSFSRDQLENLRDSLGKSKDGMNQLTTWEARAYITFDATTQLYTKTEEYLAKHPQQEKK